MITPKCTGSTPIATATGSSTGVRIVIAATVSMKQPTTSRTKLIIRRMTHGRSETPSSSEAAASGTRFDVRIQAKIDAPATTKSTTEVVSMVSKLTRRKRFSVSVR